jgi:site-specific recombinase XerD
VFDFSGRNRRASYIHLKKWAENAKIKKDIAWHTSRRTFATLALENGADIYTVAKLLGHKSVSNVTKYAKVTDKLRRTAVDAIPETQLVVINALEEESREE